MRLFLFYLACVSVVSVVVTIYDKFAAKRGAWRIPEKVLMLLALLGGSVAMYVTMLLIRHKTRHSKFMYGIPAIIVLQVALVVMVLLKPAFFS